MADIKQNHIFEGVPMEIRIVSNNICDYPCLESNVEVEQHITINADGRVWFSAYPFVVGCGQHEKSRSKHFSIEKVMADKVLNTVAAYFTQGYNEICATDIGDWHMELTNIDGKIYKFRGSLCSDFEVDGIDLSDLIRDAVDMDDLYVFDGNCKPDKVIKITVDYHRVTKIKPKQPINETNKYVTWDYSERLVIDKETESIEHIQNIGSGCVISRKYMVESGVEGLLDDLDADYLFINIQGNPLDVIDTPLETKDFTITIDYMKKPQRIITGTYDKNGLPEDWAEFAKTVFDFMQFYGLGEILDPTVYEKIKRRKNEYIFCSVTFDEGYKSYYYITNDDSIEIGDFVLVPAGKDNHTVVVEVVNIEYFSEDNVPLPVDKTKGIIRKCTDEDFDLLEELLKEDTKKNMHQL